jgi:hypothetical protein
MEILALAPEGHLRSHKADKRLLDAFMWQCDFEWWSRKWPEAIPPDANDSKITPRVPSR